jgi:hypothetical protein
LISLGNTRPASEIAPSGKEEMQVLSRHCYEPCGAMRYVAPRNTRISSVATLEKQLFSSGEIVEKRLGCCYPHQGTHRLFRGISMTISKLFAAVAVAALATSSVFAQGTAPAANAAPTSEAPAGTAGATGATGAAAGVLTPTVIAGIAAGLALGVAAGSSNGGNSGGGYIVGPGGTTGTTGTTGTR